MIYASLLSQDFYPGPFGTSTDVKRIRDTQLLSRSRPWRLICSQFDDELFEAMKSTSPLRLQLSMGGYRNGILECTPLITPYWSSHYRSGSRSDWLSTDILSDRNAKFVCGARAVPRRYRARAQLLWEILTSKDSERWWLSNFASQLRLLWWCWKPARGR